MQLLNVRFSLLCRSTHLNNEGKNPIILRVKMRGERKDVFTGIYCRKVDWDAKSGTVQKSDKAAKGINENLKVIVQKANLIFDELKFSGSPFTIHELVERIKGFDSKPDLLVDFLEDNLRSIKAKSGVEISKATYYKYRRSLSHVKDFIECHYKVKNIALNKITIEFLNNFYLYLRKDKAISHNTTLKYLQFFKTFLNGAIKNGIIKNDPFSEFRYKPQKKFVEYLTQDEIEKLINARITSKDLDRIRDIFVFACFTGLAYSDIKYLRSHHILSENDNSIFIRKPRQKTGQESIIPLLKPAIRILKKYSLTGNITDLGWYVSSNQKMNIRLKEIGKIAGIEKELHMHLARHSFATTITLSNGIPIETVSHMLGHASIKQTQHYAKIVAKKVKKDMEVLNDIYL